MLQKSRKFITILGTMVLAMMMFVALPATAYAVEPSVIDAFDGVSDLNGSGDAVFQVTWGSDAEEAFDILDIKDPFTDLSIGNTNYSTDYSGEKLTIHGSYIRSFLGPSIKVGDEIRLTVVFDNAAPILPTAYTIYITVIDTTPVCEINGTQYTLADAIEAVQTGETIKLIMDVTLVDDLYFHQSAPGAGRTYTFDTSGHELDFAGCMLGVVNQDKVSFVGCDGFKNLASIEVANDGTEAEFDNSLTLTSGVLYAMDDVLVTVNGDIIALNQDGVHADAGAKIVINGDVTAGLNGVVAIGGSEIHVSGSIYAAVGDGVYVFGSTVNVGGNIVAGERGVYAEGIGSRVDVRGDILSDNVGVLIRPWSDGSTSDVKINVEGSIVTKTIGIGASECDDWQVTVGGSIDATLTGIFVEFCDGWEIIVSGSISSKYVGIAVLASQDWLLEVKGNIDAEYTGVGVFFGSDAKLDIAGNIRAGYVGIFVAGDMEANVLGNIVVTEAVLAPGDEDAFIFGAGAGYGARVTVEGTITTADPNTYVALCFVYDSATDDFIFVLLPASEDVPSSRAGYKEYNDRDYLLPDDWDWPLLETPSFIWVGNKGALPGPATPDTGDNLLGYLSALGLLVCGGGFLQISRARRSRRLEE